MYLIFIVFLSFTLSVVNTQIVENIIKYYDSESVEQFSEMWENYRKPIENAIESALQDTVGVPGMNVYVRKKKDTVTSGYYHSDNQVKLILKDLRLHTYPRCWFPEVQFSLPSNALNIQSNLSPMIMHADYSLVRNKSDIIYDQDKQDPSKASPFLFQPVQDVGRVAISLDGCVLYGFIMTTLTGESVNLGYHHFDLTNCQYTIEIYREGDDSPPVIARYYPYSAENGLTVTQLLLRQLNDELMPKLQGIIFSFVNTSSIFENKLQTFIENQEQVFKNTSQYLTEVIRHLNKITIDMNQGTILMKNYVLHWNDGRAIKSFNYKKIQDLYVPLIGHTKLINTKTSYNDREPQVWQKVWTVPKLSLQIYKPAFYVTEEWHGVYNRFKSTNNSHKSVGEQLILTEMVLTGLDTVYSSHIGGPFHINTVMVAEQIRFSSLQIRGYVDIKSSWADRYSFASVISDLAVDVLLETETPSSNNKRHRSGRYTLRNLVVTNYGRISFAVPSVIFGSAEALIAGYLLNEVPKLITAHLYKIFPKALEAMRPSNSDDDDLSPCAEPKNDDEDMTDSELKYGQQSLYSQGKTLTNRDSFKKVKKRFKSAYGGFLAGDKAKLRAKCKDMEKKKTQKKLYD